MPRSDDLAKGERLLKDVYESLRASPKWDSTLFLVTYDDIGGYFDHVIPPSVGVPAPEAPCNEPNDGFPSKFDFRRLGGRTTSLLMGGLVPNEAFQEPKRGPTNTSQFDLASVAATVHKLVSSARHSLSAAALLSKSEGVAGCTVQSIHTPYEADDVVRDV